MIARHFTLKPFSGGGSPVPPRDHRHHRPAQAHPALRYELRGDLAAVTFLGPADQPARLDGLWEETCFECFLAYKDSSQYWELNLSPAGHWNVYGFEAYRRGMDEEPALAALPFTVRRAPASLVLTLEVDVARLFPRGQALVAAIVAVTTAMDGTLTYWALAHPGPQPDFHRRDSFLIRL